MAMIQQLSVGGFDHNFSYLIVDEGVCAIVDPTGTIKVIEEAIHSAHASVVAILLTHGHGDHTQNVKALYEKYPSIKIYAHPRVHCGSLPIIALNDGEIIPLENTAIHALFAPGHTEDSVVYQMNHPPALFTGDTLFIDDIGFGNPKQLFQTLQRIKTLPDELRVYSGHNYSHIPTETLGGLKQTNPFLKADNMNTFNQDYQNLS